MTQDGRHRSDRPAGSTTWAAVLGMALLACAVAGLAVALALLLL